MRRVIFNQKGGVGKSTITCNLAAISASRGKKTLVIDLDLQGNSSQYLLGKLAQEIKPNLYDFFEQTLGFRLFKEKPKPASYFIHPTPFANLSIMPTGLGLEMIQNKLEIKHKIYKLREALETLLKYEQIYIDTPPALNFFSQSALIAADCCLIPFDCDDFSRRALYILSDNIAEIRQDHNPRLRIERIIVNQFQANAKLPKQIVAELQAEGLPVSTHYIPPSIKVRESHQQAKPLIYYAAEHKVTQTLIQLYEELETSQPI
jgi:chromosome partitioning protein